MPEFIVRVGTPDGHVIDNSVQALTASAAEDELRRQGMHVFEAKRGKLSLRDLLPRSGKVINTERFLTFNQELLALARAGLPLLKPFTMIRDGKKTLRFREWLVNVRDKIKPGVPLPAPFAGYAAQSPPIY